MNIKQLPKTDLTKQDTFQLIEGIFSSKESREILQNIFKSKIQFHTLKNFSSQERFGKVDAIAVTRIPHLTKSLSDILTIIDEAEKKGALVEIKSEVVISITEK